jgi:hypothetical protein
VIKLQLFKTVKGAQMKKLEDIPKKKVFDVPEGYFDSLPGIIQARVSKPEREITTRPVFAYALRYALPVVLVASIGIFWLTRQPTVTSPEAILASIETEDLVAYLETTDFTTDELLDEVSLDANDVQQIEAAAFGLGSEGEDLTVEDLEDILSDMDINNL